MGEPQKNIKQAISKISTINDINVNKTASYYCSKAWGGIEQQDFVNTVIEISTVLNPEQLLQAMQSIENDMGREKTIKWGPRNIDIDILLYDQLVVNEPHLVIPHQYLTERYFVLVPLNEINTALVIPNKGKLSHFIDQERVSKEILSIKSL
jgi:dihydroneopterin aldolase/2-amino-4-hydroxy-6-hydroxymethyldihydropteridine diphosphokinase